MYKVLVCHVTGHSRPALVGALTFVFFFMYCYCFVTLDPFNPGGFVALHWFREHVSSFCSPQGFFGFRIRQCHRLSRNRVVRAFMPVTGARPKAAKINLMDCSCLCSEVEIKLNARCK